MKIIGLESTKEWNAEKVLNISNEEVKSAIFGYWQDENIFFDKFKYTLTKQDEYIHNKDGIYMIGTTGDKLLNYYARWTGIINENECTFIQCYCPSTDRLFFLSSENLETVQDCVASLLEFPEEVKKYITGINRQGEIYSLMFDSNNLETVNKILSKKNQNMTCFSGKEYFDLIKYEY